MNLRVDIEDAFEVGVEQGRKEMARVVKTLCLVTEDVKHIAGMMDAYETNDKTREELKKLLSEAAGAQTTKSGSENEVRET